MGIEIVDVNEDEDSQTKSKTSVKKKKTKKNKIKIKEYNMTTTQMSQSTNGDLNNEEIEERVIGIDEIMKRLNEHCLSKSEEPKLEICECLKALNESKPIDNEQYVAHDDESED